MGRRPNQFLGERITIPFAHGSTTADTATKIWRTGGRPLRIDRVVYVNPTGLAVDASNYFDVQIRHGAGPTVAAKWSTLTGSDGALVANTFVTLTPAATDGDRVVPINTDVELNLEETGTATLPAGSGVIEGVLL